MLYISSLWFKAKDWMLKWIFQNVQFITTMGNHRIEEIFITNFLIGGFDGLNEKEFVFSVVKTLIHTYIIGELNGIYKSIGTDH